MMTDEWRIIYDELRITKEEGRTKNEERRRKIAELRGLAYECWILWSMYIKGF